MKTTGNAGGVHNLFVNTSDLDFKGMLKLMGKGLLVVDLMGDGVNIVTGDYSRGVFGFWVERGEIQYPVEGVTIAGNLKEMLLNIVAVGKDVDRKGGVYSGSILLDKMMVAGR
jgi:PmbA protein